MASSMYIPQAQMANLRRLLVPGKVVVVYGARRVGKTTLVEHLLADCGGDPLSVSGEDIAARGYLESESIAKLKAFVGSHDRLVVDEAQHVKGIGLNLKLLTDHVPDLRIVATGSSSFGLARDSSAPLAGRRSTLNMYPLSQMEISGVEEPHETAGNLEMRLIYGSYPEVVTTDDNEERQRHLRDLVSSYLFKDILEFEGIRKSDKLVRLLQLLAFQIGNEVSLSELGSQLGMSKNTVDRYLDLLEQVFVIYRRPGFSRNLRKEISKSHRYYFFDNGIRNAVINNFNLLDLRDDVGALWENYLMAERLKRQEYLGVSTDSYFWRTYDQKEIDLVEEREGRLYGYEMKWGPKTAGPPRAWTEAYPDASFQVVNRDNYLEFVSR